MGQLSKHLNLFPLDGQISLEEDEKEGLMIKNVGTREELDEYEQKNIESAYFWLAKKRYSASQILTEKFICDLHYQMFKNVWRWAGKFRKNNKSIGIDSSFISVEIKKLLDDCTYWIDNMTFNNEEIAIRLKHRLVFIHPFSNGNSRHSRLMADIAMEYIFKDKHFSWGSSHLLYPDRIRDKYIKAIRRADKGDYADLIIFAKS